MAKDKQRDNSLDFLRGWAAINIIFIHTCFWTGEAYVPVYIRSLSLLVDVPFFFFLSGWSFSYVNSFWQSIRGLLDIYKKYLIFLLYYIALLYIVGRHTGNFSGFNLQNFYSNLFFLPKGQSALPVVMGSIWFMPVYFAVVPVGSYVLSRLWHSAAGDKKLYQKQCLACLVIVAMGLLYTFLGYKFFYFSLTVLFYLFFYLLGMVCSKIRINAFAWAALLIMLDLAVIKTLGGYLELDIGVMQNMKFPPNIIYLLYSLLFIFFTLWLKTKLTNVSANNVLCRVGRLALLFYFCQGISSSLLYFGILELELGWWVRLPLAFGYNFAMCLVLVMILHKIYTLEEFLEKQLKKFFIRNSVEEEELAK